MTLIEILVAINLIVTALIVLKWITSPTPLFEKDLDQVNDLATRALEKLQELIRRKDKIAGVDRMELPNFIPDEMRKMIEEDLVPSPFIYDKDGKKVEVLSLEAFHAFKESTEEALSQLAKATGYKYDGKKRDFVKVDKRKK